VVLTLLLQGCRGSAEVATDMGLDWGEPDRLAVADYDSIVSINIFVALLCACVVNGHLLEGNRWANESHHRARHRRLLLCHCTPGVRVVLPRRALV
jgi:hypothetical protein